MALVMVLLAIVVLTVYLTEVQAESTTAFSSALSERDRLRAEYLATSGINLSRMLIAVEPSVRQMVEPMFKLLNPKGKAPQIPVWEFADQVLGPYNDAAAAEGFTALTSVDPAAGENLGLGGLGRFEAVTVDEDSKIDVNVAARGDIISRTRLAQQILGLLAPPQYNPLFEQEDFDGQFSDRQTLCSAIIDWVDSDEEREPCDPRAAQATPGNGSEDNIYQTLGLPYFRKNAAFDSLDELRLVRGVGDDFWATFVDPGRNKPKERVLTVWSQGRINVNTANAQTLLAIVCAGAPDSEVCLDPVKSASFVSTISLVKSFTAGAPLFGSPKDFIVTMQGGGMVGPFLAMGGIQPVKFRSPAEMAKIVTTESKVFSVYSTGVVPSQGRETRVTVHAVIDFRRALTLADMAKLGTAGADSSAATSVNGLNGTTLDPVMAQIAVQPGGNVVYWRVE
ncbi:MAG: general secretion pathway protein GspK [Deltaproteobacteria bacterium]|nr:general secretion pathway protein GspK [Deltaproteobacteria bacterium]